jgi:hypothetical protein
LKNLLMGDFSAVVPKEDNANPVLHEAGHIAETGRS